MVEGDTSLDVIVFKLVLIGREYDIAESDKLDSMFVSQVDKER